MTMKLLDDHHVVSGWAPVDVNGGLSSDYVSLKNYNRVTVLLSFGLITVGSDADIVLTASDDVAATHTVALNNYKYRKSPGTTASDTFAAEATIADSKIDLVAGGEITCDDDGCIVAIELTGADLKAAGTSYVYDCIKVAIGNPGQPVLCSCLFILSDARYAADTLPSAIID